MEASNEGYTELCLQQAHSMNRGLICAPHVPQNAVPTLSIHSLELLVLMKDLKVQNCWNLTSAGGSIGGAKSLPADGLPAPWLVEIQTCRSVLPLESR